ncbi:uncharacterized protein LOC132869085 [Neoarius graeffei]|uniref:uncharacterized protein LOC132869085 n=1 Tax=Neoarius graeffei TaxID=443677 RepID=UPI00298C0314|nr:uncharacterized protein LOC132869085 [Neoarius graeffei]
MEPRKFAVVRWLEGEDYGKLSDLRTEAILKYEDDKMDQEGNPKNPYSAYIEWCHGRKHKGGWPHFKASILFVAANRYENSMKLNSLLEVATKPPQPLTKRVCVPPARFREESEDDDSTDIEAEPLQAKKSKVVNPAEQFLNLYGHGQQARHGEENADLQKTIIALKQEVKDLKEENAKWKEMVLQDVPGLIYAMRNIINSKDTPSSSPHSSTSLTTPEVAPQSQSPVASTQSQSSVASTQSQSSVASTQSQSPVASTAQPLKVEIYPGSGVFIDKLAWTYAENSNTATVFVRHLLVAVFPLETLLVSNLRGTNRGGADSRVPLDKLKVDAIYSATIQRFPHTPLATIGTAINAKITELRAKNKSHM